MAFLASEMQREGFNIPLLIGGATTSRVHTAVKIAPNYRNGQAVYVNDASRAVGVAQSLLGVDQGRLSRRRRAPITPMSRRRMRGRKAKSSACR